MLGAARDAQREQNGDPYISVESGVPQHTTSTYCAQRRASAKGGAVTIPLV